MSTCISCKGLFALEVQQGNRRNKMDGGVLLGIGFEPVPSSGFELFRSV